MLLRTCGLQSKRSAKKCEGIASRCGEVVMIYYTVCPSLRRTEGRCIQQCSKKPPRPTPPSATVGADQDVYRTERAATQAPLSWPNLTTRRDRSRRDGRSLNASSNQQQSIRGRRPSNNTGPAQSTPSIRGRFSVDRSRAMSNI